VEKIMTTNQSRALNVIMLGLGCLVLAGTAQAGGPYPMFSGISAAAEDAFVASKNPAGMTRFSETQKRFDVLGFFSESTWESQVTDTGQQFSDDDNSTTLVPVGSYIKPFRDNWWFGFTVLGSGFSDDYGKDSPGRYLVQDYDLLYISAYPSLATKVTDKLSVAGSLALTYTSYEQTKAVLNLNPGYDDGRMLIDADDFTVGFGLSALYEISDKTRLGVTYRSEVNPEMSGNAKFSDLTPLKEQLFEEAGLLNAKVDVESQLPQVLTAGIFHEFASGHAVTVDVVWMDFSEFKLAQFHVNGNELASRDTEYDDFFTMSASYSWPVSSRMRIGLGALFVDDMVDDDERNMSVRVDSTWGLGVGIQWRWRDQRTVTANLGYLDGGDAPVTASSPGFIGEVSGRFTEQQTIFLQVAISMGSGPRG
jgi:long-chain fatty acid transport protein